MLSPSLFTGAAHVIAAEAFPATATTPVGAPGTVPGVIVAEGDEAGPVPAALVAVTSKE